LLIVVKKPRPRSRREELLKFYEGKMREVVAARRRGVRRAVAAHCTAKLLKTKLREDFKGTSCLRRKSS